MPLLLSLALLLTSFATDVFLEAEDAELFGVQVETSRAGYSGGGYVTGFDEDGDSLRFEFESDGNVLDLRLGVALDARSTPATIWIDGVETRRTILGAGAVFAERQIAEQWFPAGTHTVAVYGNFDVDYLRIVTVQEEGPTAPPEQLSDPDATPSTRALHRFLLDEYGKHILAGQQDMSEILYVENVTGKVPAVGAFDFIDYSPSRVECGTRPGLSAENWIDWAGRDGIVTLMWHWNAPTDLIDDDCNTSNNAEGQEWWSGFYTRATTFDFAEALEDTTSERYQLILRDIDAIAVQLQKFEDADVPVLWRPLHEAAGGWFWWGAQGAEPFVALWRLMYDRLVNVHGLHNLIWVYTHQPNAFAWYPGDAYVDVVGRDYYEENPIMEADWDQLQETYGDRKLVTLSESGLLPDPNVITAYGVWWSWFAMWSGRFIRDIDQDYLRHVFQSELVLTRDELPDWRALYTSTEERPSRSTGSLNLYPNPMQGESMLRATLPAAGDVRVEVFDAAGRRVSAIPYGHHAAGIFQTSLDLDAPAGVYFVRLSAPGLMARSKLVLTR